MFGLFKKKQPSKNVEKAKTIDKQTVPKASSKVKPLNKEKKQSQKLASYLLRQQTQGQFVYKKKVGNFIDSKKQQKSNRIQTPKIKAKKNMKQIQQRDTQRPQKMMTEPYDVDQYQNNQQRSKQQPVMRREQPLYQQILQKEKINLNALKKTLQEIRSKVDSENELMISREYKKSKELKETHQKLFYSKYFRFYHLKNYNDLIERYGEILQSLELLISKLSNRIGKGVHFHKGDVQNQQKLQTIYIGNESQFLLFFKHFFSKPYTLCNRPSTRKVIQVLWEKVKFKQSDSKKLFQQLKLWVYGISIPSNPTLIILQKVVLKNPQALPKYAKMIFNDQIYMGVNEVDPLMKSPLILAAQLLNKKAIQKLIKCGANPFQSPCYVKKGEYQFQCTQTKYKKHIFSMKFPQYNKKILSPLESLLFVKQDYNLINDCFYFMELANIRSLKKQTGKIKDFLKQIPDCTFQIDWKTYRGMLNFKQAPSDIISVYKKGSKLRIDYNLDSIDNSSKGKHFTILIKSENQKDIEFYEIRHHSKSILNRMTQIDMNIIKQRMNDFCSYPHAKNSDIFQCKGMFDKKSTKDGNKLRLEMTLNMENQIVVPQNIKKNPQLKKPIFKNVSQYERSIFQSELVDYKSFSKSQVQAVITQNIINEKLLPIKLKSKTEKSNANVEIDFDEETLKMKHFAFILSFFKTDSIMISKILKIMSVIEIQDVFGSLKLMQYLPTFTKINLDRDFSFQVDIKNLNYVSINDNIFNVECRVIQDMHYEENVNSHALDSIQQTVLMEQGYSINVSQFLGRSQKLFQLQQQYARDKFQKMLEQTFINSSRNPNILDELQDDD